MKIEELIDVPEEQYTLYLKDYKADGKSYGADMARDADYRYQTENNNVPKSKFFGKVKSLTGRDKESTWASGSARAVGRTLVEAVPNVVRGVSRVGQEAFVKPSLNLYDVAGWYLIDREMENYKESVGFDNMSAVEKMNFIKTDPTYKDIQSRMRSKSREIAEREDPKFKQATDELYGELKKRQQEFIKSINLNEKETDPRILVELSEGAGSLLEAGAIVAITKNPTAAAYVFGVQQGSGLYEEAREKGVDVAPALGIATAGGAIEGVLEEWGLHKLAENITTKTLFKAAGKSFLTESIQETSQQAAEEALMYKIRDDEGFNDKAVRVVKSGIYGGFLGSMGSIASRPFVLKHAKTVYNDLVNNDIDESRAKELVDNALYGTEEQKAQASHDIQVALESVGFQKMGFSYEESESLAEHFSIVNQYFKNEVIDSFKAELDPATYEGGSVESGVKFLDENIGNGALAEDFDIAEDVKKEAIEGGMSEEQAGLLSVAVDSFAKTMYNKTGITPRESWEDGALHLMIKDERPNIEELQDVPEEEMKAADDGSYIDEQGNLVDKDGKVLFQSSKDEPLMYAIHNIDRGGLKLALKVGGLAMPSFAVRNVGQNADNQFGEISLIGNKELSSPSRSVEVYDRDAWSPSIAQAINYDLTPDANKFIKDILKKNGREREFSTFVYNIVENLKSPESNHMAMDLYRLDKGIDEEVRLWKDKGYLDWYEKNILDKAEPYLWTENDANTDMIRRKFTIGNMMKILRKQERSGGGWIGDFPDAARLLQYFAYKYPSLKKMKADKNKIVSREEQREYIKKLDTEFFDLAEFLKKDGVEYDYFEASRGLAYALVDEKGIKQSLERDNLRSDEEAVNKVKVYQDKLKNVPTDYFEAKPRRAVSFEEFSGVIMPNDSEYDILEKQLSEKGLIVKRVEKGNAEQYKNALNEIGNQRPKTFFQNEANPRGMYKHSLNEKILEIFKNGDASSVVHELGHYFTINYLEALQKAGQEEEAREILDWLGLDSIEELLGNSPKAVDALERLARGFETYVMTSEAPSSRLKEFFERFKNWMLKIYEALMPEQINDKVRNFFDKMLVADEVNVADVLRLYENKQDVRDVIQEALAGKAVEIGGIKIDDIKALVKAINARIPKKAKTLLDRLKDVGINEEFAKSLDLQYALGVGDLVKDDETLKDLKKKKLVTQKQINQVRKLITKEGGISREDELINFLHRLGLIEEDPQTYADTSALWDKAVEFLENAENTYAPEDIEKAEKREEILGAIRNAEDILSGLDYEAVLKALKDLTKNKTVGVQKETLKYIKGKQKEIDAGYKKLLKQMLKAQKNDLQEVRDAVVDFIKEQPILNEDKAKLLGFIKKANSMNTLQKLSEQIRKKAMEYYDKEMKKELNRAIQKEIKQTKPYSGGEQKYDYENNKLFQTLRAYNKLTREKAGEELAKLPLDEETISDLTETDLIKRRFLSYKASGADASTELMSQVLKDIIDAKEKGRSAKSEEEHQKMVDMENDRQELIQILDESKSDPKKLSTIIQNKYRTWITNLYSMLNSIFGKKIADKYQLETKQTDVNARIWKKTTETIKGVAKILNVNGRYGVLNAFSDMAQKKYTLTDKEGLNKEIDTFGIIDIYNAIKNAKSMQDYYSAYGEEQINGLVNMLTVQERALGDYMMSVVNDYYDKLNETYIKLYGIDLPKVDNYWPATSEHKDSIDIQGDYFQQTTIPSALKERSRGRVIPNPKNAWEKFNKHIAEAEYISGLGLDYMNIKKIFKSRRIKSKIIEKFGEGVYKSIMEDIESLSMASKIQEIDEVGGFFQNVLNNFVLAKIAIGIPVFVKQLTSCTNYAVDMPVKLWAKEFAYGLAHPKATVKYMMENAPFLKARFGKGYNEALERVIRDANKMSANKVKWTEAMSSFTRYGDIGAIIFGGYPYLKYLKDTGVSNAEEKFEFSTLRSQQSGTPVSLSPWQRSDRLRMLQAFNNTPMQYMRMIYDSIYQYKNGDITAQQMCKQLFNFGIIQPILYVLAGAYVGKMISWDGEDNEDSIISQVVKQILINPISGIPLLSDGIEAFIDRVVGNKIFGINYVLFSDVYKASMKLNKKELNSWDVAEIITPIVEGSTGAPMGRFEKILKKKFKD